MSVQVHFECICLLFNLSELLWNDLEQVTTLRIAPEWKSRGTMKKPLTKSRSIETSFHFLKKLSYWNFYLIFQKDTKLSFYMITTMKCELTFVELLISASIMTMSVVFRSSAFILAMRFSTVDVRYDWISRLTEGIPIKIDENTIRFIHDKLNRSSQMRFCEFNQFPIA